MLNQNKLQFRYYQAYFKKHKILNKKLKYVKQRKKKNIQKKAKKI